MDCHPLGRPFPNPTVREFLRAMGVVTCPKCYRTIEMRGKHGKVYRPRQP